MRGFPGDTAFAPPMKLPLSSMLLAVLVAGCGQKGPLYLPGDPSEVRTEIPEVERGELPPAEDDDAEDGESGDENRPRRE